jgi:class 3 adenylate cyclase
MPSIAPWRSGGAFPSAPKPLRTIAASSSSAWAFMSATSSTPATILGDGINIAARLETIAAAGEIRLSAAALDQVRDRVAFAFEDLGEHLERARPETCRWIGALPSGGTQQRQQDRTYRPLSSVDWATQRLASLSC